MINQFETASHVANTLVLGTPGNGRGFFDLNRRKLRDPNALFLGAPGVGLGYFTKKEIMSSIQGNKMNYVFIVDTWGEYAKWIREIGGEVITVTSVANISIPEDNRIVCYDLGALHNNLNIIATITVIDTIWNSIKVDCNNDERCYIYVDDAALAFENTTTARCIYYYFKSCRPYGFIMTLISRDTNALLGSEIGLDVFNRTSCTVLFNQRNEDVKALAEIYHLSDEQVQSIHNSHPGEGLIIKETDVIPMKDCTVKTAV